METLHFLRIHPWLDELLRHFGRLQTDTGHRRLDTAAGADVLLETVAEMPHQSSGVGKEGGKYLYRHPRGLKQKRAVGDVPEACRTNRYDQ